MADQFVRVRLSRVDNTDLALFEFDYDLTMMVFFLNAQGKVYARYGGRDPSSPDARQSLAGLRYTMQSVLSEHRAAEADRAFAPRTQEAPKYVREVATGRRGGRCMHCHQIREAFDGDLKRKGAWTRDMVYRYPLPENLGVVLEVDRGNVVRSVTPRTPAAAVGLRPGDVLRRLANVPIHSFGDVQFALDRAPATGTIPIVWRRGADERTDQLTLSEGWRQTDISWRPSLRHVIPSARLYGPDLTAEERAKLGLKPRQLAFRQRKTVSYQASSAGIHTDDIIVGVDGKHLELTVDAFQHYIQRSYLIGDRVTVNLLRDGKRLDIPMTLRR